MTAQFTQRKIFNKAVVRQSFDDASDSYNQFTSLQREIGSRLLEQRDALNSPAPKKVLDIGAGTGYLTKKISEINGLRELYGLDIAVGMLNKTKSHLGEFKAAGLICADAESIPLAGSAVNAVYSNLAYQWCSDLQRAIDEAYRVIKPEGTFTFSTFGPQTLRELKASWSSADNGVHVNEFIDDDSIRNYLAEAGFCNIDVSSENIINYYDSPKHLMLDLKGMGAHNMNPGRNHGLTGIKAFKSMLSAYEALRTEKGVPACFQAVYVTAEKPAGCK